MIKKALATGVASIFFLTGNANAVDVSDIFDSYSVNSSGAYTTSQGQYWHGGSFQGRIPQHNAEFVRFSPPSLSSSCSGIDIFAGSFGLISGDELVQVGRGIAQGAAPYFFGLALSSICPSCKAMVGELSAAVDELNRFGQNSCQQSWDAIGNSTGINDKLTSWAESKGQLKESEDGNSESFLSKFRTTLKGKDYGDLFGNSSQQVKDMVNINVLPSFITNRRTNMSLSVLDISTKKDYASLALSLAGSVYIKADTAADCAVKQANEEKCYDTDTYDSVLTLKQLYEGTSSSESDYYECDTSECMNVTKTNLSASNQKGILNVFVENISGTDGLIERLHFKQSLDPIHQKIQIATGFNFVRLARDPSIENAKSFGKYVAKRLALEYVRDIGYNILAAMREGELAGYSEDKLSLYHNQMQQIRSNYEAQYREFLAWAEGDIAKDAEALKATLAIMEIQNYNKNLG